MPACKCCCQRRRTAQRDFGLASFASLGRFTPKASGESSRVLVRYVRLVASYRRRFSPFSL